MEGGLDEVVDRQDVNRFGLKVAAPEAREMFQAWLLSRNINDPEAVLLLGRVVDPKYIARRGGQARQPTPHTAGIYYSLPEWLVVEMNRREIGHPPIEGNVPLLEALDLNYWKN